MTRTVGSLSILLALLPISVGSCARHQSETPRSGAAGVQAWTAQLQDTDPRRRAEAARLLGASRRADAIAPLSDAVSDADLRVRLAAVKACGVHRSPKLIPALQKTFADKSKELRRQAIRALAKIGTLAAGEAMIGSLDGASMWLRPTVALALTALQPEDLSNLELGKKVILAELAALRALGKPGVKRAQALLGRLSANRHTKFAKVARGASAPSSAGRGDVSVVGVAECDTFIKILECYAGKVPAAAAGPTRAAIQRMVSAWRTKASGPAKSSLANSCKMALNAFRKAVGRMPTYKGCFP